MLLIVWLILVFILGAIVGSFLNVCIYRLPYEKSLIWPGSRCGQCLQPIRRFDNIPLLGYWILRGRCRNCGVRFSFRYFVIELFTASSFAGLFYLEVIANVHELAAIKNKQYMLDWGLIPAEGWMIFGYHAILLSLLIVASVIDMDHLEIPLSVTITGTILGLAGGALLWPWLPATMAAKQPQLLKLPELTPRGGVYAWPLWNELPAWLPPGSALTGLATGLAGMAAGMVVLRTISFLFKVGRGREGMGLGDADLMMMVGAFVGWQPVVVAFFVAVLPGLVFGIMQLLLRGDKPFPFGPSLAAGSMITLLGWHWLIERFPLKVVFFEGPVLIFLAVACAVFMFMASLFLRLLRGPAES